MTFIFKNIFTRLLLTKNSTGSGFRIWLFREKTTTKTHASLSFKIQSLICENTYLNKSISSSATVTNTNQPSRGTESRFTNNLLTKYRQIEFYSVSSRKIGREIIEIRVSSRSGNCTVCHFKRCRDVGEHCAGLSESLDYALLTH